MWQSILLVATGGGAGSALRFLCQRWVHQHYPHAFPWGTFLVNIAGCLLIGLLWGLIEKGNLVKAEWRLLLVTGFCGGYTTFSSFAAENIQLLKDGRITYFLFYSLASVLLGILAAFAGMMLTK